MNPLSDSSPESAAWTSASVQRPQPWGVGIRENGPGAWDAAVWGGPTGIAPRDAVCLPMAGQGEAQARSSPAR